MEICKLNIHRDCLKVFEGGPVMNKSNFSRILLVGSEISQLMKIFKIVTKFVLLIYVKIMHNFLLLYRMTIPYGPSMLP